MEERAVIDRFVDDTYAVLLVGDEQAERVVPVTALTANAGPGVWLRVWSEGDDLVEAEVDVPEMERVRTRIADKMDRLRSRGRRGQWSPGGRRACGQS
jgi:hypothetical protein